MPEAFICAYKRTPIGRFAGALAEVRPDDLLAHAISAMLADCATLDPAAIDVVRSHSAIRLACPARESPAVLR